MHITAIMPIIILLVNLALIWVFAYVIILIIKALKKYLSSQDIRDEKSQIKKSLGQVLKEHRVQCNMTQEFVAENLGVSRQAVSKWETVLLTQALLI